MAFHVGQKVEHVGWKAPWYLWPFVDYVPLPLPIGAVYTVSAVYNHGFGRTAIDLVEVPAPRLFGTHPGWISFAFKAVVEKKTDISIFTAMLNTKQRELV